MDEETRKRLEAIEARLVSLENRPVATLEVAETKPSKRGTNPRNLSPEQKAIKVAQLRAGKAAAQARREAVAEQEPAVGAVPVGETDPEARARADAKADMVTERATQIEAEKKKKVEKKQAEARARLEKQGKREPAGVK